MSAMTEADVLRLLRERHPAPAWAFLEHVANGTGRHQSRTADAVAMSLWPSRGLELHGFEVKVWRGDWLRELADPAKADEIATRCDRWWVVATPDVVADGELPTAWGLMVVEGASLRVAREAPLLTPAPLDRPFLAAILRRAAEGMVASQRHEDRRARFDKAQADAASPEKVLARLARLEGTATKIARDISDAVYRAKRLERTEAARAVEEADDAA